MIRCIGAWKGLEKVIGLPPDVSRRRFWLCLDSTSVIWCLRGNAADSSQWAFHKCQDVMLTRDVRVRWAPGHTGIVGNEAADKLADFGAKQGWDAGMASKPTVSGIRSICKDLRLDAQRSWWTKRNTKLSAWYKQWNLEYKVKAPPELDLPRATLHRLLAIRSAHGDFAWYHTKFAHDDAELRCSCKRLKTPEHLVFCRKSVRKFRYWPNRPNHPPMSKLDGIEYLSPLLVHPTNFKAILEVTKFYSEICTR